MKSCAVKSGNATLTISAEGSSTYTVDGTKIDVAFASDERGVDRLRVGNRTYDVYCKQTGVNTYDVWVDHVVLRLTVQDRRTQLMEQLASQSASLAGPEEVKAPMPGLVVSIGVQKGDSVSRGQGLLILEAMKMENEIRSPMDGKISSVEVSGRETVEKGQLLMTITPVEGNVDSK